MVSFQMRKKNLTSSLVRQFHHQPSNQHQNIITRKKKTNFNVFVKVNIMLLYKKDKRKHKYNQM